MKIQIRKFFDCVSSYERFEYTSSKVLKDENGEYAIKTIVKEVPCGCHPETCCHFDGKKTISTEEKTYKNQENEK